jgi:hypothetical protein
MHKCAKNNIKFVASYIKFYVNYPQKSVMKVKKSGITQVSKMDFTISTYLKKTLVTPNEKYHTPGLTVNQRLYSAVWFQSLLSSDQVYFIPMFILSEGMQTKFKHLFYHMDWEYFDVSLYFDDNL